jgi:hypothetical protein
VTPRLFWERNIFVGFGCAAISRRQGLKSSNRTLNCKFEFRIARGSAKVIERRKRVTRRTNPGSPGAALGG